MKNENNNLGYEWWEDILSAQRVLQQCFPDCVLVGGSAAALYCDHRISTDGDHVPTDLKERFGAVLEEIEGQQDG